MLYTFAGVRGGFHNINFCGARIQFNFIIQTNDTVSFIASFLVLSLHVNQSRSNNVGPLCTPRAQGKKVSPSVLHSALQAPRNVDLEI